LYQGFETHSYELFGSKTENRKVSKILPNFYVLIAFIIFALYNNTIIELFSSILSSLELIRRPYGRARNERIDREWRKGVIAANWPDHFPSGATRGSFARCERRSDRGKERASCETHEWLCKTFGEAGSTGLNCDRAAWRLRN